MLNIVFLLLLFFFFWRQTLSGGVISFFNLFYFVFVLLGLIGWPIFKDQVTDLFSAFDLDLLSEGSAELSARIVLLGLFVVNVSYWLAAKAYPISGVGVRIGWSVYQRSAVTAGRFLAVGLPVVAIASYYIGLRVPALLTALSGGGASATIAIIDARSEFNASYISHQFLQNLLPIVSVIAYARYRIVGSTLSKYSAIIICVVAALGLVSLFKKGPLLVAAIQYYIIYQATKKKVRPGALITPGFLVLKNWRALLVLLSLTSILYFIFSGYYLPYDGVVENIFYYLIVALSRIFGRLSIPAVLYADFFPAHHEFYGIDNVGLITSILSMPLYLDTTDVYSYYSLIPGDGSVAASAIVDFYGQAGMLGVLFGSISLGFILFGVDASLKKFKTTDGSLALYCIAISFVYYLSQASIFRCLAGYGGLFYLLIWILMYGAIFPASKKNTENKT